jgi:hypothetical protein
MYVLNHISVQLFSSRQRNVLQFEIRTKSCEIWLNYSNNLFNYFSQFPPNVTQLDIYRKSFWKWIIQTKFLFNYFRHYNEVANNARIIKSHTRHNCFLVSYGTNIFFTPMKSDAMWDLQNITLKIDHSKQISVQLLSSLRRKAMLCEIFKKIT